MPPLAGRAPAPSMERSTPAPRLVKEVVLKDNRPEQNRTPPPDSLIKLQGIEHANKLREFNEKNQDPREALRRVNKSVPPLTEAENNRLVKVDPTLANEAKQFDTYSSVVDEARRTHQSVEEVCKAREGTNGFTTKNFQESHNAVIDRMMKADYVTERIPGYETMDKPEQRVAVEAYVAAHPGVREKYISEVRIISREALKLGEDPTEAGKRTQSERSKQLKDEREAEEKKIKGKLGKQGDQISEDDIEKAFDGDKSVEQAEMALLDKVLDKNGIKPAEYNAYQEQQRMAALEREFQEAHKKGSHAGQQFDLNGYVQGNENDPRVAEFKKLQARNPGKRIVFSDEDQQRIKAAEDAIFGEVRYVRGVPFPIGGVRDELQKIHDNLGNAQRAEKQQAKVDPEAQAKADGERAALKDRLSGAMEKSVDEALLESYDELQEINKRKIEAEKEDAGERERRAIDAIDINQKRHGIRTGDETDGEDKGKKIINRKDIGEDVRRLAQDGDRGLRRLVLRNLAEGKDPLIKLTNEDGSPKYFVDADGKPCEQGAAGAKPATWETINEKQLSSEDFALLDSMHKTQGDRLAQTILVDYFFARKPLMKGRTWGLKLKNLKMIGLPEDLKLSTSQEADLIHFVGADNIRSFFQESRDFTSIKKILDENPGSTGKHGGFKMMLLAMLVSLGGLRGIKKEEYM